MYAHWQSKVTKLSVVASMWDDASETNKIANGFKNACRTSRYVQANAAMCTLRL